MIARWTHAQYCYHDYCCQYKGTGVKVIKRSDIQRFVDLQTELNDVIDARTAELEAVLAPAREDLSKISSWSQIQALNTLQFQSYPTSACRDYFGPSYVNFDLFVLANLWRDVFFSWDDSLRTFRFNGVDLNLMKMIFKWLDRSYIPRIYGPQRSRPIYFAWHIYAFSDDFSILSQASAPLSHNLYQSVPICSSMNEFKNKSTLVKSWFLPYADFLTCCW